MSQIDDATFLALAKGLRSIIRSNPVPLRNAVEDYLEEEMKHLPMSERLEVLDNLMLFFPSQEPPKPPPTEETGPEPVEKDEAILPERVEKGEAILPERKELQVSEEALLEPGFAQLVSLILGKKVSIADLSPPELSEKLAQAMNTVFDTLNQIVEMIQVNLLGRKTEQETIRQIIGSHIGSGGADNSLQNYLDQIREAFLVAHKASRTAALSVVRDMLAELDPEKMAASSEGMLKFGPLRKAELFEVYKEKFGICRGWLESGRVAEGFLREFEKACQKIYKKTA